MQKRSGVWKHLIRSSARQLGAPSAEESEGVTPLRALPDEEDIDPISVGRSLWLLAAGLPVLGSLAWYGLARRSGSARHRVRTGLYALWPLGLYALWRATLALGVEAWAADDIQGMGMMFVVLGFSAWVGALVEADREWRALAGRGRPPEVDAIWETMPLKSRLLGWALWASLGWCGAHRMYCGRWASGLLYCCTFGLLGLGWGYDLFRVLSLVEETNRNILASNPARAPAPADAHPEPPAWAQEDRGGGVLEMLARVVFFVLAPGLMVLIALLTELHVVIVLVGVVCVVSAATEDVGRWLEDWGELESVPLLGDGMAQLHRLHALYQRIPPRSLVFYLLYPLTMPATYFFSPQTRAEVAVIGRITSSLALLVALDAVLGWTPQDVAELGVFILVFNIILVALTLQVIISLGLAAMTSAIRLNLTGHRRALRGYTLLGLATAIPAGLLWLELDTSSIRAALVLDARLKQPGFMEDIRALSTTFLVRTAEDTCEPHSSTLRGYVGGLMSPEETLSFEVACGAYGWRGVYLEGGGVEQGFVVARSPEGALYEQWADIPASGQEALRWER